MNLSETIMDPVRLSVRFQPIFTICDQVSQIHSVEALIRGPRGTNFERADVLFDYVRRKKAEAAMDRTCLCVIARAVTKLPLHLRINVNVHAISLMQKAVFSDFFLDLANRYSLAPDRFTVEIVEHGPACDADALVETLTSLRAAGVQVALDDVGLGHSNYRMMVDCHPEYFKLDSYFVKGLNGDRTRAAVVESLITLAKALGSRVVAEGVESSEDSLWLARVGVEFAQANLFCPALPVEALLATGLLGSKKPSVSSVGSNSRSGLLRIDPRKTHIHGGR